MNWLLSVFPNLIIMLLYSHVTIVSAASNSHSRSSFFPSGSNAKLSAQQRYFNDNVYVFIDRVTHIGVRSKCDSRITQSDVQAKMRTLKSILSTCNSGYCRVAMSQAGHAYGSSDFNLDSKQTFHNFYQLSIKFDNLTLIFSYMVQSRSEQGGVVQELLSYRGFLHEICACKQIFMHKPKRRTIFFGKLIKSNFTSEMKKHLLNIYNLRLIE
jgi:hypothetical protein